VEAIIAEPYGRRSYLGLTQWAERHKVDLGHPKIEPPKLALDEDRKTANSDDGSSNWLMYDQTRTAWSKGEFFKNYPEEKVYRHSLKEEVAAFRMAAEGAAKDLNSGKVKKLSQSLEMLVKLNETGLLEAYVLFARPDQGIARDYPAYRVANRDKLRRYWMEVVIEG